MADVPLPAEVLHKHHKKHRTKSNKVYRNIFNILLLFLFIKNSVLCYNSDYFSTNYSLVLSDDDDLRGKSDMTKLRHSKRKSDIIYGYDVRTSRNSDWTLLNHSFKNEPVNFYVTDEADDGEMEMRMHFDGVYAKETYVRYGPKLWQITDGEEYIQLIMSSENEIIDCDVRKQIKESRKFINQLTRELKELEINANTPVNFDSGFEFKNVTLRVLQDGDVLPRKIEELVHVRVLKKKCERRHEELKKMAASMGNAEHSNRSKRSLRDYFIIPGTKWCGAGQLAQRYNELGTEKHEDSCCREHDNCPFNILTLQRRYGTLNARPYTVSHCVCDRRQKRGASELFRVPGTKWCGKGYSAKRYSQLGGYKKADRCCRMHDLRCPFWIGAMESKYGVRNWRMNTLMHCRCDERFRACLKLANTPMANMVGKLFFNVVQTQCFVLKPAKVCTKRSWWGKCLRKGLSKQAYFRDNLPY